MFQFITNKRKAELIKAESELHYLRQDIRQLKDWCAYDSPEIGFAMLRLDSRDMLRDTVSGFRDKLRKGLFTFDNFKNM